MKNKTIKQAIKIAYAISPESLKSGLKSSHVAFLIKNNKIVKIGWNKNKTHPKNKYLPYRRGDDGKCHDVKLHAEMDVILKVKKTDLSDYELLVLRVDGEGKLNNSKPCPGCQMLINGCLIDDIYYSTSDQKIEKYK